jgi:hypothetical protein
VRLSTATLLLGALALIGAGVAAPWANSQPDGLDATAQRHRLAAAHGTAIAPLPDYTVPALGVGAGSVRLAGLAGVVILLLAGSLLMRGLGQSHVRCPA